MTRITDDELEKVRLNFSRCVVTWRRTVERELKEKELTTWAEAASAAETGEPRGREPTVQFSTETMDK